MMRMPNNPHGWYEFKYDLIMISRTDKFHLEHPLVFTPITAFTLLLLSQRDDGGEVRVKQLGTMDITSNQFELV